MKNILIIGGWASQKEYFNSLSLILKKENNVEYIDFNNINSDFEKKLTSYIDKNQDKIYDVICWSMAGLVLLNSYSQIKKNISSITFISSMAKFCKNSDYKIGWNQRIVSMMCKRLSSSYQDVLADFNKNMINSDSFPFEIPPLNANQINSLKFGLEYLIESDFRDATFDIDCPVLLIHGNCDSISPIEHAKFMLNNISSYKKLVVIDNSGHMPFYTDTQLCTDNINIFLKGDF